MTIEAGVKSSSGEISYRYGSDNQTVRKAQGIITFIGNITEASAREWVKLNVPIPAGFYRTVSRLSVGLFNKTLFYEVEDVERPTSLRPDKKLEKYTAALHDEIEAAKKAGKLDLGCALLRIIKRLEGGE